MNLLWMDWGWPRPQRAGASGRCPETVSRLADPAFYFLALGLVAVPVAHQDQIFFRPLVLFMMEALLLTAREQCVLVK